MQVITFSGFENQIKSVGKKYKFDTQKFFKKLYLDISRNPKKQAVVIAETESYQILKRRVKNPKIRKKKSHGFRIWYCLQEDKIYFCLFEDVGEKVKEKSTQYHIARIRAFFKAYRKETFDA